MYDICGRLQAFGACWMEAMMPVSYHGVQLIMCLL